MSILLIGLGLFGAATLVFGVGRGISNAISSSKNNNKPEIPKPTPSEQKEEIKKERNIEEKQEQKNDRDQVDVPDEENRETPEKSTSKVENVVQDNPNIQKEVKNDFTHFIDFVKRFIFGANQEKNRDLNESLDKQLNKMGVSETIKKDEQYKSILLDSVRADWVKKIDDEITKAELIQKGLVSMQNDEKVENYNVERPVLPNIDEFMDSQTETIDLITKKYDYYKKFENNYISFKENNLKGKDLVDVETFIENVDARLPELIGYVSNSLVDYDTFVEVVSRFEKFIGVEKSQGVSVEDKDKKNENIENPSKQEKTEIDLYLERMQSQIERVKIIPDDIKLKELVFKAIDSMGIDVVENLRDEKITFVVEAIKNTRQDISKKFEAQCSFIKSNIDEAYKNNDQNLLEKWTSKIDDLDKVCDFDDWYMSINGFSNLVYGVSQKHDVYSSVRVPVQALMSEIENSKRISDENKSLLLEQLSRMLENFESRVVSGNLDAEVFAQECRSSLREFDANSKLSENFDRKIEELSVAQKEYKTRLDKHDGKFRIIWGKVRDIAERTDIIENKFEGINDAIDELESDIKELSDKELVDIKERISNLSTSQGNLRGVVEGLVTKLDEEITERMKLDVDTKKKFKTVGHKISELDSQLKNMNLIQLAEIRYNLEKVKNSGELTKNQVEKIDEKIEKEITDREKSMTKMRADFKDAYDRLVKLVDSKSSSEEVNDQINRLAKSIVAMRNGDLMMISRKLDEMSVNIEDNFQKKVNNLRADVNKQILDNYNSIIKHLKESYVSKKDFNQSLEKNNKRIDKIEERLLKTLEGKASIKDLSKLTKDVENLKTINNDIEGRARQIISEELDSIKKSLTTFIQRSLAVRCGKKFAELEDNLRKKVSEDVINQINNSKTDLNDEEINKIVDKVINNLKVVKK